MNEQFSFYDQFNLRVIRVVAYGHSLEELPEGMTGELTLSGDGIAKLSAGQYPFTVIGNNNECV